MEFNCDMLDRIRRDDLGHLLTQLINSPRAITPLNGAVNVISQRHSADLYYIGNQPGFPARRPWKEQEAHIEWAINRAKELTGQTSTRSRKEMTDMVVLLVDLIEELKEEY